MYPTHDYVINTLLSDNCVNKTLRSLRVPTISTTLLKLAFADRFRQMTLMLLIATDLHTHCLSFRFPTSFYRILVFFLSLKFPYFPYIDLPTLVQR